VFKLTAQNITISFQPKVNGTIIDSVIVTNQRIAQKVKLLGNESLTLTKVTGITDLSFASDMGYIFPNPCNGITQICFTTVKNQMVKVNVYNISGQLLRTESHFLMLGQHRFNVIFPTAGIYNVSILKDDRSKSFKAVCFRTGVNRCGIEYCGSQYQNQSKSAKLGKTLSYTQGDILLHSVFSGKNNTIITDSPVATKAYSVEFYQCIDPDNKSYKIVKIGDQWWMAENLAWLPFVSYPVSGSYTDPFYYVLDYRGIDISEAKATPNYSTYGVLYNWPAAMNGKASSNQVPSGVQGACPSGWHLPSKAEWEILENYMIANGYNFDGTTTENKIAKSLAATIIFQNWEQYPPGVVSNDISLNNKSGFNGLPGGYRTSNGTFNGPGGDGYWWSSTEYFSKDAYIRYLDGYSIKLLERKPYKKDGYSVRCIRN